MHEAFAKTHDVRPVAWAKCTWLVRNAWKIACNNCTDCQFWQGGRLAGWEPDRYTPLAQTVMGGVYYRGVWRLSECWSQPRQAQTWHWIGTRPLSHRHGRCHQRVRKRRMYLEPHWGHGTRFATGTRRTRPHSLHRKTTACGARRIAETFSVLPQWSHAGVGARWTRRSGLKTRSTVTSFGVLVLSQVRRVALRCEGVKRLRADCSWRLQADARPRCFRTGDRTSAFAGGTSVGDRANTRDEGHSDRIHTRVLVRRTYRRRSMTRRVVTPDMSRPRKTVSGNQTLPYPRDRIETKIP